jgi:drug/metabolite transporter (DMT)-like permease
MGFLTNGILIAIIAHGLIGISLVWDKILLKSPETQNLISYIFWMGAISIFGIFLIFFGFHQPPWWVAGLSFGAGAFQMVAVFYYYLALKRGEASEALAVMGGFSPAATALIGWLLLGTFTDGGSLMGFLLLVIGGFAMFLTENVNFRRLLPPALLASASFGLVNVLQKIVFNQVNFVSGYVFFTLGTFAASMLLLVRRSWRREISESSGGAEFSGKFWYMVNRLMAGVGSFLTYYAISRDNPAIVDAISGVRYAIIFLGAYGITKWKPQWLEEEFEGAVLLGKIFATLLVVAGLVVVGLQSEEKAAPATVARAARLLQLPGKHPPSDGTARVPSK